jgi:hypothetical protein
MLLLKGIYTLASAFLYVIFLGLFEKCMLTGKEINLSTAPNDQNAKRRLHLNFHKLPNFNNPRA